MAKREEIDEFTADVLRLTGALEEVVWDKEGRAVFAALGIVMARVVGKTHRTKREAIEFFDGSVEKLRELVAECYAPDGPARRH